MRHIGGNMHQDTVATAPAATRAGGPAQPPDGADGARGRRKIMAILAGGLVLGVGAAITLAAWTDREFASGAFGSGAFSLVGSPDGTAFSEHPTAPGAALTFAVGADRLTPNATVYHLFSLKLGTGSNYGADLTLTSNGTGTIAPNVSYGIVDVGTGTSCDATAFAAGTAVVPDSTPATLTTPDEIGTLASLTEQRNYCIAVTASGALGQSQTGSITWEFLGTSAAPIS
ncbi:hypothetical protein GCM10009857_33060 [Agromyces soli]